MRLRFYSDSGPWLIFLMAVVVLAWITAPRGELVLLTIPTVALVVGSLRAGSRRDAEPGIPRYKPGDVVHGTSGGYEEGDILELVGPEHPQWGLASRLGVATKEVPYCYMVRWRHINYPEPTERLTAERHIYGRACFYWRLFEKKYGKPWDAWLILVRIVLIVGVLALVGSINRIW